MKGIIQLFKFLAPYKWNFVAFGLLTFISILLGVVSLSMTIPFLQVLFEQVTPPATKPEFYFSIDSLLNNLYYWLGQNLTDFNKRTILAFICGSIVVLFFLKNTTTYLSMHVLAPMRAGIIYRIRKALYGKITELPLSYFTEQKKGDIISRMSSDVVEFEWAVMGSVVSLLRDPLLIISYLIAMFIFSPTLTLFVFVLLPISALVIGKIGGKLKRASFTGQGIIAELMVMIEESLSGIRVIKGFNGEAYAQKKFDEKNSAFYTLGKRIFRQQSLSSPVSEFLGSIVIATVMWFGGSIVLSESLDPKLFITYITLFSQIISPAKAVTNTFYNVQKGVASLSRIKEILDEESKLKQTSNPIVKTEFTESIDLQNVRFKYTDKLVIDDVSLHIQKGQTVALVGSSGAGKSTLADLIARFYDPTEGEIYIDGIPVHTLDNTSLRALIGIVPQQPVLFNDTVWANIAFGENKPDMERVAWAAKLAFADEFIAQLPQTYDTFIGDQGSKLSGGQRQRLAIARALYKNPPILILDEATSALDAESEKIVQDAIQNLMQNRTSIVIAHRLSTIQHADVIAVLDNGKIVETGTHKTLITQNGVYRKLYELNTLTS